MLLDLNLLLFVLKTQIHQQFQDIQAKEPCLTLNFVIVVDSVLKIKTIVLKEIFKKQKQARVITNWTQDIFLNVRGNS